MRMGAVPLILHMGEGALYLGPVEAQGICR